MEVVGLEIFVQDDVNKLIARFVGVKPPKFMKELKYFIRDYQFFLLSRGATEDEAFEYHNRYEGETVVFHTHLLWHEEVMLRRNCYKCFKNKVRRSIGCYKCEQEDLNSYEVDDGCD